ncbi:MAG TPA: helix-turn-helix domain-containing protein [Acidimicrobiales bacterium]|nr:helix-turn-helix domain-containing protein [Acidimicrobiales bacterium]
MASALAEMESEIDRLADQVAGRLSGELVGYGDLPVSDLLPGVRTSLVSGLAALRERRAPNSAEIRDLAEVAEQRAHQGLPLEAVLAAYRLGAREAWSEMSARARARGIGPELLLDAAELVWAWTDTVTAKVAAAHRRAEILLARHDQQQRVGFLQALVTGSLSPAEAHEQASSYGMPPDARYVTLRARPAPGLALYQLEQQLVTHAGGSLLLGVIEGELVGILGSGVELQPASCAGLGTFGMGPASRITDMSTSFNLASRVLEAAVALGLRGAYRIDDLGVLLAVTADDDLSQFLHRQYLEPLEAERNGQQLLESLQALLEHGLSVDRAARALHVHPNTLRYRLRRVRELINADWRNTDDMVALWWALQRRRVRAAESARGGEPRRITSLSGPPSKAIRAGSVSRRRK